PSPVPLRPARPRCRACRLDGPPFASVRRPAEHAGGARPGGGGSPSVGGGHPRHPPGPAVAGKGAGGAGAPPQGAGEGPVPGWVHSALRWVLGAEPAQAAVPGDLLASGLELLPSADGGKVRCERRRVDAARRGMHYVCMTVLGPDTTIVLPL